jgi:hypothetical protein
MRGTLTDEDIKNLERRFESDNSEKWMFPDRTFCSIPEFFNRIPIVRRFWLTIYARFHGYKIVFINGPGPEHKRWFELS